MSATSCQWLNPRLTSPKTCIEQLASGGHNPPDLCPFCTRQFMAALDGISGSLSWHPSYVERAGSREVTS